MEQAVLSSGIQREKLNTEICILNPSFISQANLTHLPRSEFVPGIGLGVGKCPYDPIDNSTAIYVEEGNPGGFPALVRENTFFFLL